MKKRNLILLTLLFIFCFTSVVYGSDGGSNYGILSLLPPLVAIILAFVTKNVVVSLFIGILSGTFVLSTNSSSIIEITMQSFTKFVSLIIGALADPWNAGIVMQVLVIGGVIELISKTGGAKAAAEKLSMYAKTPVSAQIITWVMGLLLFFDDYANALIVGPIMRPIFDKMSISREKLAFIVDATAAPIAGIALISTWIGLEVGLIQEGYSSFNIDVDGYTIFLQSIPYRFYNIYMLAFVLISAVTLKDFGSMYIAEKNSRTYKISKENYSANDNSNDFEPKEGVELSIYNAVIPIATLVISAFINFYFSGYNAIMESGTELQVAYLTESPLSIRSLAIAYGNTDASVALLESAILASIVAIAMAVIKKIYTLAEAIETWIHGMQKLIITGVILVLAWSLGDVISLLGGAEYLVENLSHAIMPQLLPTIIFIFASVISFSTGTAYGTLSILMPLAIPMAISINPYNDLSFTVITTSAVLAGAIFGDHCSPISDTTILSSTGSSCSHIDHVKTQSLYAFCVFLVSIVFGYLPAGFGIPIYIILPIGILSLFAIFAIFGKKVI